MVKKFIKDRKGRIEIAFLPAYAPELNKVEYLWGYWKMRELPNFCAKDYGQLSETAISALPQGGSTGRCFEQNGPYRQAEQGRA